MQTMTTHELAALCLTAALGSCGGGIASTRTATTGAPVVGTTEARAEAEAAMGVVLDPRHALAHLSPTEGQTAEGLVRFDRIDGGTRVTMAFTDLAPGSSHGVHIHEGEGCDASDRASHPPGYLGNVTADANGEVHFTEVLRIAPLDRVAPAAGFTVVLHANADHGVSPTGDAGPRIACGVIEPPGVRPG